MKQSINRHRFHDAFRTAGRIDQFSYDGLEALFEYLEQYEEDTGEEVELDVIALCCEYSEYDSFKDIKNEYGTGTIKTLDDLRDNTQVIECNNGHIIIRQF